MCDSASLQLRRFCQQRKLKESQFYWWQRELKKRQQARTLASQSRSKAAKEPKQATFALVSEDGGDLGSSGIELVLRDGRRLRILAHRHDPLHHVSFGKDAEQLAIPDHQKSADTVLGHAAGASGDRLLRRRADHFLGL